MGKHLIHVKITDTENVTKYIPTIRKYDNSSIVKLEIE